MNERADIFAFCADNPAQLCSELQKAQALLNADAPPAFAGTFGDSLRKSFNADSPCRLLIAGMGSEAVGELIVKALEWLNKNELETTLPPTGVFYGEGRAPGRLAFIYPGQGSQYPNMGQSLVECFDEAQPLLEKADRAYDRKPPLRSLMYPAPTEDKGLRDRQELALRDTAVAQPGIGTVSLLMTKILARHGIYPNAAGGHSYGELTALHAGGWIEESDFLRLSVERGRLMAGAGRARGDRGAMLAVIAPLEKISELIGRHGVDVILANRNGPKQGVLSGPTAAIDEMQSICKQNRIRSTRLPVSAAFHSRLVEDAAAPFRKILESVDFHPGRIPVYANTTAMPYPEDPTDARNLLGEHLLNPVRFVEQVRRMCADGVRTFIEVGPKAVLTGLVRNILADRPHSVFSVDGSAGRNPAILDMAGALCRLAALGYPVRLDQWPGPQAG